MLKYVLEMLQNVLEIFKSFSKQNFLLKDLQNYKINKFDFS